MKLYVMSLLALMSLSNIIAQEDRQSILYKQYQGKLNWDEHGNYVRDIALLEEDPEVEKLYKDDYAPELETDEDSDSGTPDLEDDVYGYSLEKNNDCFNRHGKIKKDIIIYNYKKNHIPTKTL